MSRFIPMLILLLGSHTPVYANDFSETAPKERKCQEAGEIAASFHGASPEKMRGEAAKMDDLVRKGRLSARRADEAKRLFQIGHTARSESQAKANAWAWCMDVL